MFILRKHFLLLLLSIILFLSKIEVVFSQEKIGPCNGEVVFVDEDGQCNPFPYILVFEDHFVGNALDNSKWIANQGTHGVPSVEEEYYLPQNVIVNNGLNLWTINNGYIDPITSDYYPYTSGEVISKFTFGYGLYAINCQLPNEAGLWPAFGLVLVIQTRK